MILLVGLGNPGTRYSGHRHNIGFMALEAMAKTHHASAWGQKFQAQCAQTTIGDEAALLLKPQTYMNESGRSVRLAMDFYKIPLDHVTVFHDELDIAPGRLRVKIGGGAAGHNGVRSVSAHIGEGFRRVRLGIGHPGHADLVTPHVLGDFAAADARWRDPLLDAVARHVPWLILGEHQRFSSAVAEHMHSILDEKD